MADFELVADGLRFPEGPVMMPDGSIALVEIEPGRITRVHPDGRKETIAEPGGGPNGLALGPDGMLYCCNNGGFDWHENNGMLAPGGIASNYSGGRIERIDPATGKVEVLYKSGDFGCVLRGPNDLVFDKHGGFWFTDHGKMDHRKRVHDVVGIFYAKADGSHLEEVVFPSNNPNGCGLSPDGKWLYAAETYTCRLMKFAVTAPGKVDVDGTEYEAKHIVVATGTKPARPAGVEFDENRVLDSDGILDLKSLPTSMVVVGGSPRPSAPKPASATRPSARMPLPRSPIASSSWCGMSSRWPNCWCARLTASIRCP